MPPRILGWISRWLRRLPHPVVGRRPSSSTRRIGQSFQSPWYPSCRCSSTHRRVYAYCSSIQLSSICRSISRWPCLFRAAGRLPVRMRVRSWLMWMFSSAATSATVRKVRRTFETMGDTGNAFAPGTSRGACSPCGRPRCRRNARRERVGYNRITGRGARWIPGQRASRPARRSRALPASPGARWDPPFPRLRVSRLGYLDKPGHRRPRSRGMRAAAALVLVRAHSIV
jgi:hypothetical protein